jgi:hypothetical protein
LWNIGYFWHSKACNILLQINYSFHQTLQLFSGAEIPEVITRFNSGKSPSTGKMRKRTLQQDPIKLAKEQFQIAAEAGCDLGLRWLKRLEDYENQEEKLKQIQH